MKILILGGDGMLGHRLYLTLRKTHDTRCTLRGSDKRSRAFFEANPGHNYFGVELGSLNGVEEIVGEFRPDVVVNCIGIVKQRSAAKDITQSLLINSLLPHRLALLCKIASARLIHISTDCVFDGNNGNYTEADSSDAEDIYGKTKFLGEVHEPHCLTLRTSIIGLELKNKSSLVEWFLAQTGSVNGFQNAVFSGFTTNELSRVIENLIINHPTANGLWHLSAEIIDKYRLLELLKASFKKDIEIIPDKTLVIDRSLNSDRFRNEFQYSPPAWETMIEQMANHTKSA